MFRRSCVGESDLVIDSDEKENGGRLSLLILTFTDLL